MFVAETPRLILRQLTSDDVDELAAIYADPVAMRFFGSTYIYESTKQWLEERVFKCYEQRGWGLWATIYKMDNKLIGRCGLIPQLVDGQEQVEIGYLLAKEYWGMGLATPSSLC